MARNQLQYNLWRAGSHFALIFLFSFVALAQSVQAAGTCQCTGCPGGDSGAVITTEDAQGCTAYCTAGGGRQCSGGAFGGAAQSEAGLSGSGLRGAAGLVDIFGVRAGYQSGPKEPEVVIGTIIQGLFVVIGVIFGLLIIYGGFLWMTARGNEDYIKKAKGILETAIIGFVLVAGAYAISSYIIDKVITAAFRTV